MFYEIVYEPSNFARKIHTKTKPFRRKIEIKVKNHSQKVPSTTFQKVDTNQKISKTLAYLALTLGMSVVLTPVANAFPIGQSSYSHPGGWKIVETSKVGVTNGLPYKNVHIYQLHNEQTYVQLVDVSDGARVALLQERSPFSSDNQWRRNPTQHWWNALGTDASSRVSVVNAQFFNNTAEGQGYTPLSFGVKSNGRVLTEGGDVNGNGGYSLKQMNFHTNFIELSNYTSTSLSNTKASNAIVGLDIRVRKDPDSSVGRTYFCAKPYYSNSLRKSVNILLIYSAQSKSQYWAEKDLESWDCRNHNTVMMDGSRSTKLYTKGGIRMVGNSSNPIEIGERGVPQVLGIYN